MNGLLTQNGIGFHVVVSPVFYDSAPDFSRYPLRDIHAQIGGFLTRQGIPHLDLLDTFAEQLEPPAFYSRDVWHPNAEGHLLIARTMLDVLLPRPGDRDDSASDRSKRPAGQPVQEREQGTSAAVMASCSNTDAQIVHAAPADPSPSAAHRTQTPASACMQTVARPGELRSP
jgi:hypothetical protein